MNNKLKLALKVGMETFLKSLKTEILHCSTLPMVLVQLYTRIQVN